jgi:hypothetical protein
MTRRDIEHGWVNTANSQVDKKPTSAKITFYFVMGIAGSEAEN